MMLRDVRCDFNLTQKEAALSIGVPLRTYIRYEKNGDEKSLKYVKMIELLKEKYEVTEDKGILSFKTIQDVLTTIFKEYGDEIDFCYLFGSYAKGYETEESDVDLCVSTNITGLRFVGLIEKIHDGLKKKVDLLRLNDISSNYELLNEIMKDGIKIYEQHKN